MSSRVASTCFLLWNYGRGSFTGARQRATREGQEEAFTRAVMRRPGTAASDTSPDTLNAIRGRLGSEFENIANRNPGFKVPLDLALSGTSGTSDRTDAQTVETFAYQLAPSGLLDMQSQGRRRTDTDTRWVTRLSGHATNGTLELQGQMFAGDGKTLVRERCSASLRRTTGAVGPSATAQNPQATTSNIQIHKTPQIKEVAPKTPPKNHAATTPGFGGLPLGEGGALYLPEDWLMGTGQPWHYRTNPRPQAPPVPVRQATPAEAPIIQRAEALMQQISVDRFQQQDFDVDPEAGHPVSSGPW
jgi:hypothetical protein